MEMPGNEEMNIGLVDVDGHGFPNFALMKISAWHKRNGDTVEWYDPLFSRVDRVYASKVFTFTEDYHYFPAGAKVIKGGTGYDFKASLPDEIENILPDYSIYPQYTYALGFLSRGCIRNCPWCVVPRKEGHVRPVDDIERIAGDRKHVVLMDNNFLANDQGFVREQLEKAQRLKLKLDFNQALDARLVTEENAAWLAKTKWLAANGNNRYIRFSCDTSGMVSFCKTAIGLIRRAGWGCFFFIYFLAKEVKETMERINEMMAFDNRIRPFVMPYRNLDGDGQIANDDLKRLANWCNKMSVFRSCKFEDYKG